MRRHLSAGLVLATLMLPPVGSGANGRATELHLATWNLEWLVSPATALASRLSCDDGTRATLPCDVARTLARDSADFARLRAYARALDADVIALQEVEDVATAQRVFRGYASASVAARECSRSASPCARGSRIAAPDRLRRCRWTAAVVRARCCICCPARRTR